MKTGTSAAAPDEVCPSCGTVYEVRIYRLSAKDHDSFHCEVCGNLMKKWADTKVPSYTLKKPGDADTLL